MISGNRPALATRRRGPTWLAALLLVIAMAAVFGRVAGHEFLVYDDNIHVTDNPLLSPVRWRSTARFWSEPYWGLYVPLSYTFFSAEAAVARRPLPDGVRTAPDPVVFHLGNLALHTACVLLVFVILRRLFRHDGAACAGALLFGLHPLQVESVAWVSETRGTLCAVFSLLAIWQYLAFAGSRRSRPWAMVHYVAATLAFLLALLCKPAAVAVPLIVVAIDWGLLRRPLPKAMQGVGLWLVAAAGWTVLTKSLQPDSLLPMVAPLWARPLLAGDAVAFYVGKLALPVQCGPDYGRTPEWVMGQTIFYIAWLAPVALVAILAGLRNRRVWLTAAAIFVLWLLPVLGLAPFVFQRISTVADRYVYLSLLGPAVALAWLLRYRWNRWSVGMTSSGLCLLAALSTWQTTHWRDDEALCSYALWVNPSSVVAWNNRGYLLIQEGRYTEAVALYRRQLPEHPKPEHPKYAEFYLNLATAHVAMGQLDDALAVTLEAVEQLPNQPRLHCALAGVMVNKAAASPGDDAANWRDAAEQAYRDALELDPHLGEAHCQLGKLLWDSRRHEEALREYRLAVDGRRLPGDLPFRVEAHVNLGVAAGQAGRVDEARHHYLAAIDVLPDRPSAHYNLAMLLQKEGKTAEAEEHYRLTLRYEPSHLAAQVNLGILLFQQDRTKEAIEQFESALRSDPEMALAHFHLGEALASEGRTDEAAAAWRAAADYAEPDSPLAREARERLRDLGTQ